MSQSELITEVEVVSVVETESGSVIETTVEESTIEVAQTGPQGPKGDAGGSDWADITSKPTTISGYGITDANTDTITEASNLYYTQARFDSAFTAKSTSDLSEGYNLYWTTARSQAVIDADTSLFKKDGSRAMTGTLTGQQISGTNIIASNILRVTKNAVNALQMDSATPAGAVGAFWMQNGVDKFGQYLDSSDRMVWYDDVANQIMQRYDTATRTMYWYYGATQTLAEINHSTGSMTMRRDLTCTADIQGNSNIYGYQSVGAFNTFHHSSSLTRTTFTTNSQYQEGIIRIDNTNANAGDRYASLGWYDDGTLKFDQYYYGGFWEVYNNTTFVSSIAVKESDDSVIFGSTTASTSSTTGSGVFKGGVGIGGDIYGGGVIAMPLGSNANPSYTFVGDTNTGIHSPSAGRVNVDCDGTSTLSVRAEEVVVITKLRVTDLPTSATGLTTGTLWNDSGTLKVV